MQGGRGACAAARLSIRSIDSILRSLVSGCMLYVGTYRLQLIYIYLSFMYTYLSVPLSVLYLGPLHTTAPLYCPVPVSRARRGVRAHTHSHRRLKSMAKPYGFNLSMQRYFVGGSAGPA